MTLSHEQEYQNSWQERQDYAESMQPLIGRLYRNKGVEISVYGRPLVSASTIDVIKAHKTLKTNENIANNQEIFCSIHITVPER